MTPRLITAADVPFGSNISPFELLTLDQLLAQPSPEFLCDPPLLVEAGLNGWFGKTGTGKTQTAAIVACAIATGVTIAGIRPRRQGPVLILDGERSWGVRLPAVATHHDLNLDGAPIIGLGGELLDAFDQRSVEALVRLLEAKNVRPVLTVIDTAAIHQRCDENSSEINIVVQNLRHYRQATGSAVLSLMHPSEGNPDRERGANSFRAAADVMLQVALADSVVTITMAKNRFGPHGEAWRFEMVPVPDVDKGVTLQAFTEAEGSLTQRDRVALAALPQCDARFKDWKAAGIAAGLSGPQFDRSRTRLLAMNRVRKDGEVYRHA